MTGDGDRDGPGDLHPDEREDHSELDIDAEHLWLAALDPKTGSREAIDRPQWDVELAGSSLDGRVQVWSVNEDGYSKVRWRVDGGPTRERDIHGVCEDLVVSADGSRAAFVRFSATEPWQVWTLDTDQYAGDEFFA